MKRRLRVARQVLGTPVRVVRVFAVEIEAYAIFQSVKIGPGGRPKCLRSNVQANQYPDGGKTPNFYLGGK
jgi:hypothetical protein